MVLKTRIFTHLFPPVLVTALAAGAALAQSPNAGADSTALEGVVMTVSGGISKGAYQGGLNWALVAHMRQDPHLRLEGVSGASAGNINSLLTVLEYCRTGSTTPRESLFWKIWIQTGIDDLMPPFDEVRRERRRRAVAERLGAVRTSSHPPDWDDPAEGIFSRDFFHARHLGVLEETLRRPDWRSCEGREIPVGITVTAMLPRPLQLDTAGLLTASTIRVASAYAVRFRRGDVEFRQYLPAVADAAGLGALVALPSDASGQISTLDVFKLTESSSAFPVAFAPRPLQYYHPKALDPRTGGCPQATTGACQRPERESFLDGGVFDNNPVDLIWSLRPEADSALKPRLIYIDQDNYREPLKGTRFVLRKAPPSGGIDALLHLAASAVPVAQQYELQSLQRVIQRYDPKLGEALSITNRALPIYGDHLGAFAAFLGKPFRVHDFYVGVYDGLHYIAEKIICTRTTESPPADCTKDKMRAAIEGNAHMPFDATGQLLLREMFEAEFGHTRPPARSALPTSEDSVYLDLLEQNLSLLEGSYAEGCENLAPVHTQMCESGLLGVVERLTPRTREVIRSWANDHICTRGDAFLHPACKAEPTFARLMENPADYAEKLTETLLERLRIVEDRRNSQGLVNKEWQVELGQMTYRSAADRYKRMSFEWDPSTIPDRDQTWSAKLLHYLVPHYFMGLMGADGAEIGWRPRYHLWRPWALDTRVGLHFWPGWGRGVAALGPSYKAGPFVTANVSAVYANEFNRVWRLDRGQYGAEFSLRLLTDKLELAFRWLDHGAVPMLEGKEWGLFVGLSDLNGLLYMIGSSIN